MGRREGRSTGGGHTRVHPHHADTFAILGVLAILLFSYRQTIKAYPSAGGAYIVTKDDFGLMTAQLAGVALLVDYVLTVAVSIAAGVAAMTSAIPSTYPYRIWLSVFFIWFVAWGSRRWSGSSSG